jgi:hypothetical protein
MRLTFALLADTAHPGEDGRLTIQGAGLETVWARAFPVSYEHMVLIAHFALSPAECGYDHALRIPFLGPDGQEFAVIEGPLRGERSTIEPYRTATIPVLVAMPDLPLPIPGDYAFHILVDGFEVATLPLSVRHSLVSPTATAPAAAPHSEEHGTR